MTLYGVMSGDTHVCASTSSPLSCCNLHASDRVGEAREALPPKLSLTVPVTVLVMLPCFNDVRNGSLRGLFLTGILQRSGSVRCFAQETLKINMQTKG